MKRSIGAEKNIVEAMCEAFCKGSILFHPKLIPGTMSEIEETKSQQLGQDLAEATFGFGAKLVRRVKTLEYYGFEVRGAGEFRKLYRDLLEEELRGLED